MRFLEKKEIVKDLQKQFNLKEVECRAIICEVLEINLTQFFNIEKFSLIQALKLRSLKHKMNKGMPLNKIVKTAFFYGREYFVNKNVLAPRPETELVCERAISLIEEKKPLKVLDLCAGSGVIGLTIKGERPNAMVTLADVSDKALRVAKKNAKKLNLEVQILRTDLFDNIKDTYDMIVSNPPYIEKKAYEMLDIQVKKYDPKIALIGGEDGLDFYREIARRFKDFLSQDGSMVLEIGYNQGESVKKMLDECFEDVQVYKDFEGNDRIVVAKGDKLK